ncbi:MAG: winged helix-turn-helix domain-containing protein, partial [Myxococcota bacterium]
MDSIALQDGHIDLRKRLVQRHNGSVQSLTTKEVQLLAYLAAHPGQAVTREELLIQVWGYNAGVVSRTIDATVRRLRTKIEANPSKPRHILTAHGTGYLFQPASPPPTPTPSTSVPNPGFVGRHAELEALAQATQAKPRLVQVVGVAGVGKTSLVRQFAATRWTRGPTLFCNLTPIADLTGLLQTLADALALPLTPHATSQQALALVGRALAARGTVLVILDNVEQMLGPTQKALHHWLPAAPE